MSLGPVVRNVHAHEHAEPPKPHLDDRLLEGFQRSTELGTLRTSVDGKLAFQPNYAGDKPAPKATAYKEPAYVPFQGENAFLDPDPAPKAKRPMASGAVSVAGFDPTKIRVGALVSVTATKEQLSTIGIRSVSAMDKLLKGVVCTVRETRKMGEHTRKGILRLDIPGEAETWEVYADMVQPAEKPKTDGNVWKVGARVQKVDGSINKGCYARIVSVTPAGRGNVDVVLEWETNPRGDDGRFNLPKEGHSYFRIVDDTVRSFAPGQRVKVIASGEKLNEMGVSAKYAGQEGELLRIDTDDLPYAVKFDDGNRFYLREGTFVHA